MVAWYGCHAAMWGPRGPCVTPCLASVARRRRPVVRDLVLRDEVGGGEDEHLAHQVGVLLVAAHEADHPTSCRVFDDRGEPYAHDLLELHALLDDRVSAPAVQEGLL